MIPKILHLVWIGEENTRPDACIARWGEMNPGFSVRLWGNQELSSGHWRTRPQMKALLAHDVVAVMECLRYEVLLNHGGVAVNALSLASAPIPDWLLATDRFALWADELDQPGTLATDLLGAESGDALLSRMIADIAACDRVDRGDPSYAVGAHRLSSTWRQTRLPLTVYPSHFLAPTYGDTLSYTGRGLVLGELLRPALDEPRPPAAAEDAVAQAQGELAARLAMPAVVEGAPPLTSSFTLPPVTVPMSANLGVTEREGPDMTIEDAAVGWAGIAAHLGALPDLGPALDDRAAAQPSPFRVVVATDWSSATVPLAILKAFADIIPEDAPVHLIFAVPHEVTEEDAACATVLLEGIGSERTAPISVESFDEAAQDSCYAAVVPAGDHDALVMELAAAITTMHHLATLVTNQERLEQEPAPLPGPNEGLRRRLCSFREADLTRL